MTPRLLLTLLLVLLPGLARAEGPGTLAVLYFENSGQPQLDSLRVGLAQMFITELQGTEGVRVVERTRLQEVLDELELGHGGKIDEATAARVGKLLGAEWLLLGGYFQLPFAGGELQINGRLVRVETGEILFADDRTAKPERFLEMKDELAGAFRDALRGQVGKGAPPGGKARGEAGRATASAPPPAERPAAPQVIAPDPEQLQAAVAFSEGLIALDRKDAERARESFREALEADPQLELAQAELARLEL